MPTTEFITQPDQQLGDIVLKAVEEKGLPKEIVIVSAFASLVSVFRFKQLIQDIARNGGKSKIVLGIDLGGTSKQVLREVSQWELPVYIFKNSRSGVIFHPKLYLLRWQHEAMIAIGSNNFTDGGLFRNYEASALVRYRFPEDMSFYETNLDQVRRFVGPNETTSRLLTSEYLAQLVALPEIPSEAEARASRKSPQNAQTGVAKSDDVFGFEFIKGSPKLPLDLQRLVIAARVAQRADFDRIKRQRRQSQTSAPAAETSELTGQSGLSEPLLEEPLAVLSPQAFFMHLPTMRADSPKIPGELRVPLEALEVAPEFWGWPDLYIMREPSPRAGKEATEVRTYRDRRARWRTWSVKDPDETISADTRMYMYANSSDFRIMVGALNSLGGSKQDIVRITASYGTEDDYDCVIAPQDTPEYDEWKTYLVNPMRNSDRFYGYA